LPDDTKRMFLAKEFVSFEFVGISPEQEEDLFARVQMGVQLSPAEKMRASTGPWQELARLYIDDFPAVYSLMKDRARAKDFQLTLSCFSQVLEVMHPTASDGVPIMKTTHNALPKLLSNKAAVDDSIKSHLANVWTTFAELIEMDEDTFTNANKYLGGADLRAHRDGGCRGHHLHVRRVSEQSAAARRYQSLADCIARELCRSADERQTMEIYMGMARRNGGYTRCCGR
jgi:hypothetical protein